MQTFQIFAILVGALVVGGLLTAMRFNRVPARFLVLAWVVALILALWVGWEYSAVLVGR